MSKRISITLVCLSLLLYFSLTRSDNGDFEKSPPIPIPTDNGDFEKSPPVPIPTDNGDFEKSPPVPTEPVSTITIPPISFRLNPRAITPHYPGNSVADPCVISGTALRSRLPWANCGAKAPIILPVGTQITGVGVIADYSDNENVDCLISASLRSVDLTNGDSVEHDAVEDVTRTSPFTLDTVDHIKVLPLQGTTVAPYTIYYVSMYISDPRASSWFSLAEGSLCAITGVFVNYH